MMTQRQYVIPEVCNVIKKIIEKRNKETTKKSKLDTIVYIRPCFTKNQSLILISIICMNLMLSSTFH